MYLSIVPNSFHREDQLGLNLVNWTSTPLVCEDVWMCWCGQVMHMHDCVYLLTILIELVALSHTVRVQETMNFKHQDSVVTGE